MTFVLFAVIVIGAAFAVAVLIYAAYMAGYRVARRRHVAERSHYEADAQAQFGQLKAVVAELKIARARLGTAVGFIGKCAEERRKASDPGWHRYAQALADVENTVPPGITREAI